MILSMYYDIVDLGSSLGVSVLKTNALMWKSLISFTKEGGGLKCFRSTFNTKLILDYIHGCYIMRMRFESS